MARRRTGIWFIGAKGGVATTATLGLLALRKGLIDSCGLVSELPQFEALDLVDFREIVVGGHEIRRTRLLEEAAKLAEVRAIDADLISRCKSDLEKVDKNIRPGVLINVGPTIEQLADRRTRDRREAPWEAVERIQHDLSRFVKSNKLQQLIVINVASTEPSTAAKSVPRRWQELQRVLQKKARAPIPASTLYAVAALDLGFPYVNFTPSLGSAPPAICELAVERQTCHMGHDGKTGETLLKSALAPIFASRNLNVMSWVGHNIFGNLDGQVLDDPANKKTKVTSKDQLLGQILGYHPQTHVSIEYIESLGDWKTAWDHIHFRGFMGTPMVMQFTWQGCDSLLAAPLVLDLARMTERAARDGHSGLLTFLASFFKSPLGVVENNFVKQFQMLESWAADTVG